MGNPWVVRHRDDTPAVACPCGSARRVLTAADCPELSVHFVDIRVDSQAHYHRRHDEVYVVIAGGGELELDGERQAVSEGTVALIPAGVRHRAVPGPRGMTIVNIVRPPFDAEDEHHD